MIKVCNHLDDCLDNSDEKGCGEYNRKFGKRKMGRLNIDSQPFTTYQDFPDYFLSIKGKDYSVHKVSSHRFLDLLVS